MEQATAREHALQEGQLHGKKGNLKDYIGEFVYGGY